MEGTRQSIIVGIDPGTTLAYCAASLQGAILRVRSSKELRFDALLRELTDLGAVVAVGTDKGVCPSLIRRFAAQTGAKIVVPDADLKTDEKRERVGGIAVANAHESDAAAACLFAHSTLQQLIEKMQRRIASCEAARRAEIERLVVRDGFSVADALALTAPHELQEDEASVQRDEIDARLRIYRAHLRALRRESLILAAQRTRAEQKARLLARRLSAAGSAHESSLARLRKERRASGRSRDEERALRRELEFMAGRMGPATMLVRRYKDERQWLRMEHPLSLETPLCVVGNSLILPRRAAGNARAELRVPAAGVVAIQTRHLALIDRRKLEIALQETRLIEDIVDEYRSGKAHARHGI